MATQVKLADWQLGALTRQVVPTTEVRNELEELVIEQLKIDGLPTGCYVISVNVDVTLYLQGSSEELKKATQPKTFKTWMVNIAGHEEKPAPDIKLEENNPQPDSKG